RRAGTVAGPDAPRRLGTRRRAGQDRPARILRRPSADRIAAAQVDVAEQVLRVRSGGAHRQAAREGAARLARRPPSRRMARRPAGRHLSVTARPAAALIRTPAAACSNAATVAPASTRSMAVPAAGIGRLGGGAAPLLTFPRVPPPT